jgi:hypothetical protein
MSNDLGQLASDFIRLDSDADRAWRSSAQAKAAAELVETRKNTSRGALKAFLEKSTKPLPYSIEFGDKLLTVYEDTYGIDILITDNPSRPQ